jgi:hypothetical protein
MTEPEGTALARFAGFIVTQRSTVAGAVCGELVMLAGKGWLG